LIFQFLLVMLILVVLFKVAPNLYIGLMVSDLSSRFWADRSDNHHTLFSFKYINKLLQVIITFFYLLNSLTQLFYANTIVHPLNCVRDGSGILAVQRSDTAYSPTAPELAEAVTRPNNIQILF